MKSDMSTLKKISELVTPYVGVWIEMTDCFDPSNMIWVTPYVGVWIEIHPSKNRCRRQTVTPYVGVWIEINICSSKTLPGITSPPMWGCGLKFEGFHPVGCDDIRHPLCGGVD